MSKAVVNGCKCVSVVIALGQRVRKTAGSYAGSRCRSEHRLVAPDCAVNALFPDGVRDKDLSLVSDNGRQPTSEAFMGACPAMRIQQFFAGYNNPKGNADAERMFRTMKEELFWLQEWMSRGNRVRHLRTGSNRFTRTISTRRWDIRRLFGMKRNITQTRLS